MRTGQQDDRGQFGEHGPQKEGRTGSQHPRHLGVPLRKRFFLEFDAVLRRPGLDALGCPAKIGPRKPGQEVVRDLVLETAVDPLRR